MLHERTFGHESNISRKGYDDKYGGRPSAILQDGTMASFPIPVADEIGIESERLSFQEKYRLDEVLGSLSAGKDPLAHHLDPDLGFYCVDKKPSRCAGVFGQCGSAAGHLLNQQIGPGDVFLFFGTFQHVEATNGELDYSRKRKPFHALFGYLRIDDVIEVARITAKDALAAHPHWLNRDHRGYQRNNLLFVGSDYGTFLYSEQLCLTVPNQSKKSLWELPRSFENIPLTYHPKGGALCKDRFRIQTAAIGQEFVFHLADELKEWVEEVIKIGKCSQNDRKPALAD
jgi:hypothetical protein